MSAGARGLRLAAVLASLAAAAPSGAQKPDAAQIVERMRAAYAALDSYSDRGVLVSEDQSVGAPLTVERHGFATRFARPKRFYFDFTKDPSAYDERYVIWCAGETFATWWSASQTMESYAPGEGQNAFAVGELPTNGAALLVPPLLFADAGLQGPLAVFAAQEYLGTEMLGDREHHVLGAALRVNHWSDTTRATRVWIDAQSYLVRKIVQDTPSGLGAGVVQRTTATFEPLANPPLDDESFRFEPAR